MAPREGVGSNAYQWWLTGLLSLNFGFVLLERNALSFLMPFVQPELGLNNTQVGLLAAGLSLTWALSAFGVGFLTDRIGSRKRMLVAATVLFALCSFGSGLAMTFGALLATRLLMGVAEGGIMPLSQSMVATQVDPRRRGLSMGIVQGFGSSLMGSFVAPVLLVAIASAWGWRHAFFVAGAPALIVALVMALTIREPPRLASEGASPARPAGGLRAALRTVLADGNVLRCLVLSIVFVAYLVLCWTFMPLYLVQVRGFEPRSMSWLMGVLGIAATLFSFAITGLSDRIGRRPVLLVVPFLALVLPLGALYFNGPVWLLGAMFFVGWTFTGTMPLFMATVPSESVPATHIGVALGLCMGGSEVIGGVLAPLFSGMAADRHGLQAPLWVMVALALLGCIAAFGLRETAPRRLGNESLAASKSARNLQG